MAKCRHPMDVSVVQGSGLGLVMSLMCNIYFLPVHDLGFADDLNLQTSDNTELI